MVKKPWGYYEVLENHNKCQLKKLVVNPGHRTSLQYHTWRKEVWVIQTGVAKVDIKGTSKTLKTDDYIYIPVGAGHRLGNNGNEELVVIEFQYGLNISESDIVRLEDDYER